MWYIQFIHHYQLFSVRVIWRPFLKQVGDSFQGSYNYNVLAKDIEVYHITWNVQLFVAINHRLRKFYRRFYSIHHKRPMVCRSAYRKGYRSVGNPWGLVVREDRSDYHPCFSSAVWITRGWKIRQPTYSRDKSPVCLLLGWQTLTVGGKENSKPSHAFIFIISRVSYVHPCLRYSVQSATRIWFPWGILVYFKLLIAEGQLKTNARVKFETYTSHTINLNVLSPQQSTLASRPSPNSGAL